MNKIIFSAIILLFLFSCKEDKKAFSLVKWINYSLDENNKVSGGGDTIAIERYQSGTLVSKTLYDSSSDKRLITKTFYYTTGGKDSSYEFSISYTHSNKTDLLRDRFGNIIEMRIYETKSPTEIYSLRYLNKLNTDSLAESSEIVDSSGNVISIIEYHYDQEKRLTLMKTFDLNDKGKILQTVDKYVFDNVGNKVEDISENVVQKRTVKTVYKYDSKKRLLKELYYDDGNLIYEKSYQYKGDLREKAIKNYPSLKRKFEIRFLYE